MRSRIFSALLCALLFAWPVAAQEQRGGIEGVVKDTTGAVLPGVTVEARSSGGAVLSTTTDGNGKYRFPSVLPGTYEVSANLASFKPSKVSDVLVGLGQIKTVDFSLPLATMTEQVNVTAESPVIDIKQSTRATNLRAEQVDLLPHNRDFTSLLIQAPGTNFEPKSTNDGQSPMIDGASAAENRYVVDGMETTSLFNGLSAKAVLADFVEEVQVKSSGYPAEYGGSTGGVVNVITKSGTNKYSGSVLSYWQGSSVNGTCRRPSLTPLSAAGATTGSTITALADGSSLPCGANPSLRLTLANSNVAEYWTYPKDDNNRVEPGGSIGGPIVRDKAWFFGAYQPAITRINRTVNAATSGNPNAATIARPRKDEVQYLTANETMQLSDKRRTRVAFNNSWSQSDGQLPALNGTDAATTNYAKGSKFINWSLGGVADYVVTPKFLLGFRAGYFRQNTHDYNVPDVVRFVFGSANIGQAGVPASLQHGSGYTNVPSISATSYNILQRKYAQADATWYGRAGGEHQIKGGIQVDLRGNNINSGDLEQTLTINWASQYSSTAPQGAFGYYQVRSNGAFPRQGFITQGNVNSNIYGLFIQDAWAVSNKLSVNLGVRTEQEKVPAYTASNNAYGTYPIQFGFKDKLAPRAGFAYDLNGNGKWKVYGSWGFFYDNFKLDLGQESFGGAKWIEWYFTLDTPNYETLNSNPNCPPACAGTFITKSDLRLPSLNPGDVSTDIKPMRSQEAVFGLEHQLGPVSAVSFRYIHKQLDRGIEDTGAIDENDDEPYIIGNPGESRTQTFNIVDNHDVYAGSTGKYTLPKPKRQYDAAEFAFDKRFSASWSFHASYTLSRDYGNYPGLSESDENGRTSPNIGRLFDYPIEQFDGHGQPLYGVLPTDRTHVVKGQFIYQLPFGTTLGVNQFLGSGIPISRSVSVIPGHSYLLYYNGRNSEGRTPVYSQTDLYVQHEFKIPGGKRFQVNANILNLFDQRTILDRSNGIRRAGAALTLDETAFYAGQVNIQSVLDKSAFPNGALRVDPRFLQNSSFQFPLQARFGVKFLF
jgi:outer membrane receptor protein involved in Fe transport